MAPRAPSAARAAALLMILLACVYTMSSAVAAQTASSVSGKAGAATATAVGKCSDVGCARCSSKGSCLACAASAGLITPDLVNGRCLCPSGSARVGARNTAAAKSSSSSSAHSGSSSSSGKPALRGCAPCSVDAYAPNALPVAQAARCATCPPNTSTNGATGASTCFVAAGSFYDVTKGQAVPCPPDAVCGGGDFVGAGRTKTACPVGSTTSGTTGNADLAACASPPGKYFDGANVLSCPKDSYCEGGSVTSPKGTSATRCPASTTTVTTAAKARDECLVAPGSYFGGASGVTLCAPGYFCLGGSITGTGAQQQVCPNNAASDAGASLPSQCAVPPGSYLTPEGAVAPCPPNKYCEGGPVRSRPPALPCPTDTVSDVGAAKSQGDCRVPAAKFLDAANNNAVTPCTQGYWCAGGALSTSPQAMPCPSGSTSSQGVAASEGDCIIPAGKFWNGSTVRLCLRGAFCLGGAISTNPQPTRCPQGSFNDQGGGTSQGDCEVYGGSFWNGNAVEPCPADSWCAGGLISISPSSTPCPQGATSSVGVAKSQGDCIVPPASYLSGGNVTPCPAGSWCAGGKISTNPGSALCTSGTVSNQGEAASSGDCRAPSGTYWSNNSAVVTCPANYYCFGGKISDNPQPFNCPPYTTSNPGNTSFLSCSVPPGMYFDNSQGAVLTCPSNYYCLGGTLRTRPDKTECPPGKWSSSGSTSIADCF